MRKALFFDHVWRLLEGETAHDAANSVGKEG